MPKKKAKLTTVAQSYEKYLKMSGLNPATMPETQYREMKKAFYAAAGSMLVFMLNEVATLNEKEGIEAMEKIEREVQVFWKEEVARYMKSKHSN